MDIISGFYNDRDTNLPLGITQMTGVFLGAHSRGAVISVSGTYPWVIGVPLVSFIRLIKYIPFFSLVEGKVAFRDERVGIIWLHGSCHLMFDIYSCTSIYSISSK